MEKTDIGDMDTFMEHNRVLGIIEKRDVNELITLVNDLEDYRLDLEADIEYYHCIMDGSWPSSVEQLTNALDKAKNHPNRKLEE